MALNSDFKELLSILNEAQVRYLIVGGYAVIEHTEPRYTKDLDIWVSPARDNAERVYASLKRFGAPLSNITVEDFTHPGTVYQMGRPPARVDILMGVTGLDFESAWNNRVEGSYGEVSTQFLSIEDIIINKRAAGRPQDLIDVENLQLAQKRNKKPIRPKLQSDEE
ncbi:MAG: DUF6036 family nucleotidyltransferase [Acidobacteriota bacterium]